jgi:hypothetical protein
MFSFVAAPALAATLAVLPFRSPHGNDPAVEGGPPTVTLPSSVEVMLLRAELDPEALAAAGISGAALSALLATAAPTLTELPSSLAAADASAASARVERDRLVRLVQSGQGGEEDVTALAAARGELAEAEAARATVLDDAFEAVTSGMSEGRISTLTQIRANAHWHVPVKYRVSARNQRAWLAIRDLLAHVRTYADFELEPLPEQASALAAFDEESAVAAAASNLATNLSGVRAAWDATFVD